MGRAVKWLDGALAASSCCRLDQTERTTSKTWPGRTATADLLRWWCGSWSCFGTASRRPAPLLLLLASFVGGRRSRCRSDDDGAGERASSLELRFMAGVQCPVSPLSWSVCLCPLLAPPSVERTLQSEMRFASSRGTFQLRRLFSIASVTRGIRLCTATPTTATQRKRRNHLSWVRSPLWCSVLAAAFDLSTTLISFKSTPTGCTAVPPRNSRRVAPPLSLAVTVSQIPRQTRHGLHAPRSHEASHDRSRSANDLAARRQCARVRQQEAMSYRP